MQQCSARGVRQLNETYSRPDGHMTQKGRQRDPSDAALPKPFVLSSDEQAKWATFRDAAMEVATAATGDMDGFRAAWDAMRQAARGLDRRRMLNAVHVPKDAGELAEALTAMLLRIPDGWGRWISCDRGWYPLVVELDEKVRALLPSYVILQIKEKYGGLRYYWEPGEAVHDANDPEPSTPARDGREAEWERWRADHEAWCERLDAYLQMPEGQRRSADLQRRIKLARQLVDAAEARAGVTCELCGAAGRLHCTSPHVPWYKTLCPGCADQTSYVPCDASRSQ